MYWRSVHQTSDRCACREEAAEGEGHPRSDMPHKNDLIIWLQMQPQQRQIYEAGLPCAARCCCCCCCCGCKRSPDDASQWPAETAASLPLAMPTRDGPALPAVPCRVGWAVRRQGPVCSPACGCGMQSFLESEDVKQALNQSQSALAAITVLKKVSRAPRTGFPPSRPCSITNPECWSCCALSGPVKLI